MSPSGVVRILHYESRRSGSVRSAWVYTPPTYHRRASFPVVYLLPGPGNASIHWALIESANDTLNRLTVHDAVMPAVVVIPIVHGRHDLELSTFSTKSRSTTREQDYATEVFLDLLPLIERSFNVSSDLRQRAIVAIATDCATGLSAGISCRVIPRSAGQVIADGTDLAYFQAVETGNNLLPADKRLRMVCMSVQDADPVVTIDDGADPTGRSRRATGSSRPVAREMKLSDVVPLALAVVSRTPAVPPGQSATRAAGAAIQVG